MKRLTAIIVAAAMLPAIASAGSVTKASEMSAVGGLSVIVGSAAIVAAPVVLVSGIVKSAADASGKVRIEVTTDNGTKETILIPKETVDKAKLQPGDKLTVKPVKSGAILAKNDTPIAYVTSPENAKLSRSHELAH
jgi:bifunctional DNA-binding transcriptional regulator/antitoxin component of YhaV-PrlF toxin-antitoxin module